MWCDKCQAEVAAIASQDNHRLFCASCGNEMMIAAGDSSKGSGTPKSAKPVRDARELLARWAQEDERDPLEPSVAWPPKTGTSSDAAPPAGKPARTGADAGLRFDASHGSVRPAPGFVERIAPQAPIREPVAESTPSLPITEESSHRELVVHAAHGIAAPHFPSAPVVLSDNSTRWVALAGQLFAYLGVGTLTVGAVLVLMGYFGDTPNYSSTGWLVTTAGQMLLMLGVVTLISGGMEQTTQEVARRIDTIGERIGRIERMKIGSGSSASPESESAQSGEPPHS